MPQDIIPDNVKQFLLQHIDSIAQLECLLLLRNHSHKQWSAEGVAKELYITVQQATALLSRLANQGFIVRLVNPSPVIYQYHPTDPLLDPLIAALADAYKKYLVPVTHLIHAKPKSKIQEFADAFRIKKD
jgi:hypothetical protein